MKALVLDAYNSLIVKEVSSPLAGPEEVIVQVKAAGICGSDVHGMDGSTGRRIPPIIMGHEASGVIHSTGSAVTRWKKGDRVTFDSTIYPLQDWYTEKGLYNLSDNRMVLGVSCNEFKRDGAFAEFVAVPQHILYKMPENVSFTEAAMVEPAAVALHAICLTDIQKEDTAIVLGSGMIGLFVIQLLRIKGVMNIIAIDTVEGRLAKAINCGASHTFIATDADLKDKILQLTGNRGADCIFDAVGINESVNQAIDLIRKGGSLTLIGNLSPTVEIPLQKIVTRQLRLQGSCAIQGEYAEILELMSEGEIDTKIILSAEVPLSDGPKWFERLYNKEPGLMKVILLP